MAPHCVRTAPAPAPPTSTARPGESMAPHRIGTGAGTRTTHQHRHRPCDSTALHCNGTGTCTTHQHRPVQESLWHRIAPAPHPYQCHAPVPPASACASRSNLGSITTRSKQSAPPPEVLPPSHPPGEEGLGSVRSTSGLSVPSIGSVRPMSPQAGIGSTGSKAVSISLPDALERCIQRRFSRWFRIWRRAVPSLGALPLPLPSLCGRTR